jgi:hypothetical protein
VGGDADAIAPRKTPQHRRRVARRVAEGESRHARDPGHAAHVDAEIRARVDVIQPRAGHAFPEPPTAEIRPRQPCGRDVVVDDHGRNARSPPLGNPSPSDRAALD